MTATVEFTAASGFIYTVGFDSGMAQKDDATLIEMARKHAAREWSAKIKGSSLVDSIENGNAARKTIETAKARVIRA